MSKEGAPGPTEGAGAEAEALAARVTRLEEQLAWFEHTLQSLDEVVRGLSTDNLRLRRELGELNEQIQAQGQSPAPTAQADLEYERPPHY